MPLPKEYDPQASERKWQEFWAAQRVFRFDAASGRPVYSIDTPPPTVSGKLHIGHVFSYTQTEIIARYFRLRGYEVYYPFGFDNNGLPTEILTEREQGVRADSLTRQEFSRLCLETARKYTEQFRKLWQAIGFSCDWQEVYYTIDERSQRVSQRSFLDLLRQGYIYRREAPTLWCTRCRTAFAQAEVDDKHLAAAFYYIHFSETEKGEKIPVATTRPELLCACVAVFIHPQNAKYGHLIGRRARVPLFGQEVPIIADENADPEKGSGVVMCCTFGDTQDIEWWRRHRLPLRLAFSDDGRLNPLAGEFQGLAIDKARAAIAAKLVDTGFCFRRVDIPANERTVNTHERCGTEVEYLVKRQWFVNIMDHKEKIIAAGSRVRWFPEYMKTRFVNWVTALAWDWCISRQRYFGVPIPAWHCGSCGAIIPAKEEQLPVNPLTDKPHSDKCPECDGSDIRPESDVLDTWATSSVTPQINAKWGESDERMAKLFPMSMRPQAHDIIRTWAFYTIVKSLYHHEQIPWHDAVISGHVLKKERTNQAESVLSGKEYARKSKISKSKDGDSFSPQRILAAHSVDCLRFWTCGASLGADTYFDDDEVDEHRRLLIKLWNAGRFVIENLERLGFVPGNSPTAKEQRALDIWMAHRLQATLAEYHACFENYDFHNARSITYNFFWHDLCDNYLEFVKGRLADPADPAATAAGRTLYDCFLATLQMFSPFIPHITEELYQAYFRQFVATVSLHRTRIPEGREIFIPGSAAEIAKATAAGERLVQMIGLIRGYKTKKGYSLRLPLARVAVLAEAAIQEALRPVEREVRDFGVVAEVSYHLPAAKDLPAGDSCRDEVAGIELIIVPDEAALQVLALSSALKGVIGAAKKAHGLAAKAEIAKLYLSVSDETIRRLLQDNEEKVKYATAAKVVVYGPAHDGLAEVPDFPQIKAGIEI